MLVAMQQDIRPNTCFGSKLTRQFCLSRSLRVYGQLMFMRIPFLTQPSNCPFSATLGTTFDTPTNSTPPSICERSGNEALARTLNRTRSVVQFSHVSHQPLVPPPLTRCLFFLFSSVPVLAGVHRILKTKHSSWFWFWRFPMAQPFQGMGLSQLATSSSDQPSLSSTPRLSMPSPLTVRQTLPMFTPEYKPLSGILPSSLPFMGYDRALTAQKFQVHPGPYDFEIPLDPPSPYEVELPMIPLVGVVPQSLYHHHIPLPPRVAPWTGRRLH